MPRIDDNASGHSSASENTSQIAPVAGMTPAKRGRGRPSGSAKASATSTPTEIAKRGRGRPPAAAKENGNGEATATRSRGRPKGTKSTNNGVAKKRGKKLSVAAEMRKSKLAYQANKAKKLEKQLLEKGIEGKDGKAIKPERVVDEETGEEVAEWKVEEIVKARKSGKTVEYRIKWAGFDSAENTWEPLKNVMNAKDLVIKFHQDHPKAPKAPAGLLPAEDGKKEDNESEDKEREDDDESTKNVDGDDIGEADEDEEEEEEEEKEEENEKEE